MNKKTDIKKIAVLLISAIVFMSVFFITNKQLYKPKESLVYSHNFALGNNLIDSINTNVVYSNIQASFKLDTVVFDSISSIKVLPTIKIRSANTELFLILTVEQNDSTIFWKSYKIQKQLKELNTWQLLEITENFRDIIFTEDFYIKTYFWNLSKSEFEIKDITIKLYNKHQEIKPTLFNER